MKDIILRILLEQSEKPLSPEEIRLFKELNKNEKSLTSDKKKLKSSHHL